MIKTTMEQMVIVPKHVVESEERLRLAAEAADLFAWELNLEKDDLKWSPNAARVIGCEANELSSDPSGRDFFIAKDDRPKLDDAMQRALGASTNTFDVILNALPGDEARTHWHLRGRVMRDASERPLRVIVAVQNITLQKLTDAELRILAERLATAEEAAGAFIYDWDLKSDELWRSAGIERMLGWTLKEMGKSYEKWAELLHPEDSPRLRPILVRDFSGYKDHFAEEYRVRHKAGHYVWLLDAGRVYRNAQGNVTRVSGARIDISERKAIEATSNRQAAMVNLSFEPILMWHPQEGIVEWNRGAEQFYGFTRDEVLGRSTKAVFRSTSPVAQQSLLEILRNQTHFQAEVQHTAKNGKAVIIEARYQLIKIEGVELVLETNHDISERKLAETFTARMAGVALASHDALFGITPEGKIESWNPAAERVFGYTASEAIGQNVSMLVTPSEREEQSQIMQRLRNSQTVSPYDARRLRKDGTQVDVSVAIAPVTAQDGSLQSLSVVLHDITERKEWEARQRLMNRELAHRNKNSFAVLQAILRSTLRTARSPQEFADAFSGRLQSLAAAQDILTDSDWRSAELGAIVRQQLKFYAGPRDSRISITGPAVYLPPEFAVPFSLIFHELATNALKYGALSAPTGDIQIYWRTERPSPEVLNLRLTWKERGGPPAIVPKTLGFGSTLIEKSIAGARVENIFEPQGLTCKIDVTLNIVKKSRSRAKKAVPKKRTD